MEGRRWTPAEGEKATDLAKGGFDTLLTCTAPIFWVFFLLTGISLFVLRERDPHIERPFKVPFYPELPLIFCLCLRLHAVLEHRLRPGPRLEGRPVPARRPAAADRFSVVPPVRVPADTPDALTHVSPPRREPEDSGSVALARFFP